MAPAVMQEEAELYDFIKGYSEVYLLVGYSEKAQFGDVDAAIKSLQPYMDAAKRRSGDKPFLLVYGGDPVHVPTIGSVVKGLQEKYAAHVLAIQASGKHESWVDAVFVTQEQFEVVKRVKDGVEVEVKETLWGGVRNGKPVGGARYYMGEHFYGRPAEGIAGAVRLTIFLGGGAIAAEELEYADALGVPWVYIPCKCKNVAAYNSAFGPVHDWVVHKLAHGGPGLALQGNNGQHTH